MKIIIFGTGKYYENRKAKLFQIIGNDRIVAFLDNKTETDVRFEKNHSVCNPARVNELHYDRIILMSSFWGEMKEQLLGYGVEDEKIISWERYYCEKMQGHFRLFTNNEMKTFYKKKVLFITHELAYGGASVAVAYAAMALQNRNYEVWIATPRIDEKYVKELINDGCNVAYVPSIPYMGNSERYFISCFDLIIANVFPMIKCSCDIAKTKPVLWWIHENSDAYDTAYKTSREKYPQYDNIDCMKGIRISAVSNIAKDNFEKFYPNRVNSILPFGIRDEYTDRTGKIQRKKEKMIFAIIGGVCERKGQIILIKALKLLSEEVRRQAEFWFIGEDNTGAYSTMVKEESKEFPEIKFRGKMARETLINSFGAIDCVLCTSLEETMSIAIVEGMMFQKICVTTDKTGIAEYIRNGENGYVCEEGNPKVLADTVKFVLYHKDQLETVKKQARETYLKHFTLDVFGERLEQEMMSTIQDFIE